MASSSPTSTSTTQWKYEVFISFRGEDTRKNFADHLFAALTRKGIVAFRDEDKLERGKAIAPELLKAIEESRFAIVLLSPTYASSSWCLDELIKILECMNNMYQQRVFPVFYGVDPSDVRKQTGNFGNAFEESFEKNNEKVNQWRIALKTVANLAGWDAKDRYESKLIQEIVQEMFIKLNNTFPSCSNRGLVGICTRLEELERLLDLSSNDVRIIGIHGMGGIGKTTIARKIFEMISDKFEASSFLASVREVSGTEQGLVRLQEQLLNEILKESNVKIWNKFSGINVIRKRLSCKKVIVVLDDVDNSNQLAALIKDPALIEDCSWFGPGSRIIITTRDVRMLDMFEAYKIYKMKPLNMNDALDLFNLKAFKSDHPKEGYLELSRKFVLYSDGLPLALEVLGGLLYGRSVDEWISTLERLKDDPEMEILDKLAISFDGLKVTEKKIFLDIACFFKGMDRDYVTKILDSCDFHASIGIKVLVEKSLITVGYLNEIWMHDMLQEMGQNIVKKESVNEPGKRSRLWDSDDVYHIFAENTGTEAIEVISCQAFKQRDVSLNPKAFVNMKKLRLLKIPNVHLYQGLDSLPNELRILEWHGYPLMQFPLSFQPDKIVELDMRRSNIKQIWTGTIAFARLRLINLGYSIKLQATPNFTGTPNVEKLILEGCTSLVEVHPSVGLLKELKVLNMRGCTSLQKLACSLEMESIRNLNLSGCSKLKNLPDVKRNREYLPEIFIDGTGIKQLSWPLERLYDLVRLNLNGCKELVNLPDSICFLKNLEVIMLSGCTKLDKLPDNLGNIESLKVLNMGGTAITQLPSSIVLLKNLKTLSFQGCTKLGKLPDNLGNIENLEVLDVGGTAITQLPSSVVLLKNLKTLSFQGCTKLDKLPDNLVNIENLEHLDLGRTAIAQSLSSIVLLKNLKSLSFQGCGGQATQPRSSFFSRFLFPRKSSNTFCLSLPPLSGLSSLIKLNLSYCNIQEGAIPFDIGSLSSLERLDMSGNEFVTIPSSINQLTNLKELVMMSCEKLRRLPLLPPRVELVKAEECVELEDFPNPLERFTSLWSTFSLFNCHRLVRCQDSSIVVMKGLKSHFQGIEGPSKSFEINLPGNRIQEWISHQNEGSSISIYVPPNWFNDDFKGFAVSAVFRFHTKAYEEPCTLESEYVGELDVSFPSQKIFLIATCKRPTQVITDHLWFFYVPVSKFNQTYSHDINHATFSFRPVSRCWDVEIRKCGARLVYAQDIGSLLDFDKPSANLLTTIIKRNRNDCVEPESEQSQSCSLAAANDEDDALQPKRLKWLPFL